MQNREWDSSAPSSLLSLADCKPSSGDLCRIFKLRGIIKRSKVTYKLEKALTGIWKKPCFTTAPPQKVSHITPALCGNLPLPESQRARTPHLGRVPSLPLDDTNQRMNRKGHLICRRNPFPLILTRPPSPKTKTWSSVLGGPVCFCNLHVLFPPRRGLGRDPE